MFASALRHGAGLGEAGTLRLLQRSMRVLGCIGNVGFRGLGCRVQEFRVFWVYTICSPCFVPLPKAYWHSCREDRNCIGIMWGMREYSI